MKLAVVKTKKNPLEPIGTELSINAKLIPELKGEKVGAECEFEIKAVKVGEHVHDIGGKKTHMIDVKLTAIEYDAEDEEEDDTE